MIIFATGLILLGGLTALMGYQLFRGLLPLVGFVAGLMVGFGGVQGVFGTGVISFTLAILMAIIVGVITTLLSFMFFDVAVMVLLAMLGASALTFLGIALGLGDNGFILFLLGLAGVVLGVMIASAPWASTVFVAGTTAYLGVAIVLAGVLLIAGEFSVESLHEDGIIPSVLATIDQSFLWLLVWVGGSVAAYHAQLVVLQRNIAQIPDTLRYQD